MNSKDERLTLLTVDYYASEQACRMIRSFKKFVGEQHPVVVVQNGPSDSNPNMERLGAKVVSARQNLGHGTGLDWGMWYVQTKYVLVADPDTLIVNKSLPNLMLERVKKWGVASIDNGCSFHHPICLAFETRLWKENLISMEASWTPSTNWDVAGALTYRILGGLQESALLKRTRTSGTQLPSSRPGTTHGIGDVYEDCFSNTYCMSRLSYEPNRMDFDGWSREELQQYHRQWEAWAEGVLNDEKCVADFPGKLVS